MSKKKHIYIFFKKKKEKKEVYSFFLLNKGKEGFFFWVFFLRIFLESISIQMRYYIDSSYSSK